MRLDQEAQGSGLGLAIVADLAALYGGGLELRPAGAGGLLVTSFVAGGAAGLIRGAARAPGSPMVHRGGA